MLKIGSVVIDCGEWPAMYRFWGAALGYVPREEPENGWVVLRDPKGTSPNISLQAVAEPRASRGRLHLDLYTEDRDAEVERLLGLGATRHPRSAEPDEDFTVLADPDGNLFCVVQQPPPER